MPFFDGFALTEVDVDAGPLRLRHGGSGAVASGHYLAEEAPAEVLRRLEPFLDGSG